MASFAYKKNLLVLILLSSSLVAAFLLFPALAAAQGSEPLPRDPFAAPSVYSGEGATNGVQGGRGGNGAALSSEREVLVLPLDYAAAEDLKNSLQTVLQGKLAVDPVTNSLVFSGTLAEQLRLRQMAAALDVATRQVTLEARLLALSREDTKNLGVNWSWDYVPQHEIYSNSSSTSSSTSDSESYGGNFKFWRGYSFRFRAELNALIAKGKAKVLARPRLITLPGKEASIFIGDHIPVQTEKHDSSGNYTSTEYIDAGIKLQYCPIVSSDGELVTASVHTEVSTPTLVSEIKNYKVTSRTADTWVRMRSGETLVIGGLIGEEESRTWQKVPFLGDLPVLGALFRSKRHSRTDTEVLMLLTPYITEAGSSPAIYRSPLVVADEARSKNE